MNSEPDHLELLAQLAGMPEADLADEHVRWQLYNRVLPLHDARDSLRAALSVEPVPSLASAVVVAMFDHLPSPRDRAAWLELLPPKSRAFPARRTAEIEIVDRYQLRPHETTAADITVWSDWLQRQIASTTFAPTVLGVLAAEGRTKRIRATAARRLAAVRTDATAHADATFRAVAEAIIETANAAVGVEVLEPGLERALQIVRQNPAQRPQFEAEIISLLSPVKAGVIELVSFLMHELRWPAVEFAIRERLADPPDVSDIRRYTAMLDSFSAAWRDRDMFARFEG